MTPSLGPFSLDRAFAAVESVRRRLLRTAAALRDDGIPYAIVGGHAVALWVSRVDAGAVRNTQDVDVLIRRADLDGAKRALGRAGFTHQMVAGVDLFLDGPDATPRNAVHVIFAGEKVHAHEPIANPAVDEAVETSEFRVINLDALVRIKLTAFRDKDRTHLRDLIEVRLVSDASLASLPPVLADRLKGLLDTPGG